MRYIATMFTISIAGFLPLLLMMALFHFIILKNDRKNHMKTAIPHIASAYIFCYAVVCILSVTGIPSIHYMELNAIISLVPFDEIFTNFHQYALNILLFIPIGFLLPMLWKKFEKKHLTILCGFFFSLSIELIQLFNNRVTDIDDLLMNTAGTTIGYFLFLLVKRRFRKVSVFAVDHTKHWKWEPYFCFCFAWISMLVFKHFITGWLFGAARFQ